MIFLLGFQPGFGVRTTCFVKTGKLFLVWLNIQDLVGATQLGSLGGFFFYPVVRLIEVNWEGVVLIGFGTFQKGGGLDS